MRVDAIRSGDIMRAVSPIRIEKPETARRVLQRIGAVLTWAKGSGFYPGAPSDEISGASKALPKQDRQRGHHEALPYPGMADFLGKMRKAGASNPIKLAFEFLILTATRTNEVLAAAWREIDLAAKIWTIPATRMKAKRVHRVPLSTRCLAILEEARKLSDGTGLVFPGTISGKPLSSMVFLMLLRRMGLTITAHGFRSSFRDWCADETNAPREVAEAALAHPLTDKTEASYRRTDLFNRRVELMEAWASHCEPTKTDAKVVTLARIAAR